LTPRRAIRRRRDLTERVTAIQALGNGDPPEISDLTGQVRVHERYRQDRIQAQADERIAIPKAHLTQIFRLLHPDVTYRAPERGGPNR
jgi:hypothetical protein